MKAYKSVSFSFSSLSYDRSKASSKASSPHSAIQSFLFQMSVFKKIVYYVFFFIMKTSFSLRGVKIFDKNISTLTLCEAVTYKINRESGVWRSTLKRRLKKNKVRWSSHVAWIKVCEVYLVLCGYCGFEVRGVSPCMLHVFPTKKKHLHICGIRISDQNRPITQCIMTILQSPLLCYFVLGIQILLSLFKSTIDHSYSSRTQINLPVAYSFFLGLRQGTFSS
jgi:hypothetical protein